MPPRSYWSKEQEQYLCKLKQQQSNLSWVKIATLITQKFNNRQFTGKQCRQRYINYAQQSAKDADKEWTQQQVQQMFNNVLKYGAKWKSISQKMIGKTENTVKNKFYGSIRIFIRNINAIGKRLIQKYTKPIKYDSLIRIFQAAQVNWQIYPSIKQQSQNLRNKIVRMLILQSNEQQLQNQALVQLIHQIHKFNLTTRSYNLKKNKALIYQLQKMAEDQEQQLQNNYIEENQLNNNSQVINQLESMGNNQIESQKQKGIPLFMFDQPSIEIINQYSQIQQQILKFTTQQNSQQCNNVEIVNRQQQYNNGGIVNRQSFKKPKLNPQTIKHTPTQLLITFE